MDTGVAMLLYAQPINGVMPGVMPNRVEVGGLAS